jgi:hypothetical protein
MRLVDAVLDVTSATFSSFWPALRFFVQRCPLGKGQAAPFYVQMLSHRHMCTPCIVWLLCDIQLCLHPATFFFRAFSNRLTCPQLPFLATTLLLVQPHIVLQLLHHLQYTVLLACCGVQVSYRVGITKCADLN